MGKGTVLFAGGGTAGHVFPALAVAEELVGRGWEVAFAGVAGGIEERLVGERGWAFEALPARPVVGRNPVSQAAALVTVARSTLAARRVIRRRGIDAVVGTGGYVSVPAMLGARLGRRPALLVEPNAEPGVANRWLSRWADGAAVAYAATGDRLHCPSWVTGVPVRSEFFGLSPRAENGGETVHLLVLGGSQGARQLNRDLPAALARVAGERRLTVLHQAGRGQEKATAAAYADAGLEVEVTGFLPAVAEAMAGADLVVSRAGAVTCAELCAAGRAALLVPLALAGAHQAGNARRLADAGAAVVVDSTAGPERLAAAIGELVTDRGRLAAMGRAARMLAREDAAAAIADRVESLAGRAGNRGVDVEAGEEARP